MPILKSAEFCTFPPLMISMHYAALNSWAIRNWNFIFTDQQRAQKELNYNFHQTMQVQILIGNHAEMQQHAAIVLLLLSTDARLI